MSFHDAGRQGRPRGPRSAGRRPMMTFGLSQIVGRGTSRVLKALLLACVFTAGASPADAWNPFGRGEEDSYALINKNSGRAWAAYDRRIGSYPARGPARGKRKRLFAFSRLRSFQIHFRAELERGALRLRRRGKLPPSVGGLRKLSDFGSADPRFYCGSSASWSGPDHDGRYCSRDRDRQLFTANASRFYYAW